MVIETNLKQPLMTKKMLSEIQMLIGKYTNYTNNTDNNYVRKISKF